MKFSKLLLFFGFCYVMIISVSNLMCEETGMTQYSEKITDEHRQIGIPAFTIIPFDSPRNTHFINISELSTVMKNGKEFPKWFKPVGTFANLTNEDFLKSNFNLTWHQVWSINAIISPRIKGYFLQKVTFTPPESYVPPPIVIFSNFKKNSIPIDLISLQGYHLEFEITDEDFDLYAVYIHEPMKSNWWTFNIDAVEIFQFKTGKRYVHLAVLN